MAKMLMGFALQSLYAVWIMTFPRDKELIVLFGGGLILTALLWVPSMILIFKGAKQYFLDDILIELKKINQSAIMK